MNAPLVQVSGPVDCNFIYRQLSTLPRPRRVILSWRGKLSSLSACLGLAFFGVLWIGLIWRGFSGGRIGWAVALLALLVIALLALLNSKFTQLNRRSITATGEFTIGRIVAQRTHYGRGAWSEITYEFTDALGRTGESIASDLTWEYEENMPVIIFYNPRALTESVPFCSTYWRVRMPDGTMLSPSGRFTASQQG